MRAIFTFLLGAMIAIPAFAANHVINVGQNSQRNADLTFNPATLSINAGDTVTFVNFDQGLHNVASTSGPTTFRCSDDCGSNSDPDSTNWSATVTFPTAGTVAYQCDQHASSGMTGTITVQAVTPVRLQSMDVEP